MNAFELIQLGLTIIGGATALLATIAPLTKNQKDDKIVYWVKKILAMISLNVSDKTLQLDNDYGTINIKIKK